MAVLVVADHDNQSLKDNTHKTVTAAMALSPDVDVLVAGQGVGGVAAEAAKIAGVRKVLTAESDVLGKQIAEAVAAAIVPLMAGYDAVLIPATDAGNALETVESSDPKKVITVRATAFKAAGEGGSASIEAVDPGPGAPKTRFVADELVKSARPELAGAKIVVSGGRAMGSAEEFHRVIEPLADRLGAAVGASRPGGDAGY